MRFSSTIHNLIRDVDTLPSIAATNSLLAILYRPQQWFPANNALQIMAGADCKTAKNVSDDCIGGRALKYLTMFLSISFSIHNSLNSNFLLMI